MLNLDRQRVARFILRAHGVALLMLGLTNAVVSYRATQAPMGGPFHFLLATPAAEVGLLQAYLLMAAIATVLVFGSFAERFWHFDVLAILAHCIPLLALLLFRPVVDAVMGPSTVWMSLSIHGTFITLEALALGLQGRALSPYPDMSTPAAEV